MRYHILALPLAILGLVLSLTGTPNDDAIPEQSLDASVTLTTERGSCSGTIVSPTQILTAKHCTENATSFVVTLRDGKKVDAVLQMAPTDTDLAVLVVNAPLPVAPAAISCEATTVGQRVAVVGNHSGFFSWAALFGSVAHTSFTKLKGWKHPAVLIAAPSYSGNSGGGVFDRAGRLVGVLVAGSIVPTEYQIVAPTGIGIAIPSSEVCKRFRVQ